MMYAQIHDRQAELCLLDDTRRFYFDRAFVLEKIEDRLREMRSAREGYLSQIGLVVGKYGLERDKVLARLRKTRAQFSAQITEELADLVRASARLDALEMVIDQYNLFTRAVQHPQCHGTGSLVGAIDRADIMISASEFKVLTSPFNRARFEEAVGDPAEHLSPATMIGVGTALRQYGHGHQPEPAVIGVDSFKGE